MSEPTLVSRIANSASGINARAHLVLRDNGKLTAAAACGWTPKSNWYEPDEGGRFGNPVAVTCPNCVRTVRLLVAGREKIR